MVLILEDNNPTNLRSNKGRWPSILNLNPRRLVILFKTPDGYREILRRDGFLPSEHTENSRYLADPVVKKGIRIERGIFVVTLLERLSYGNYTEIDGQFKFRYENENRRFRLIGYDRSVSGSGKQVDHSINYLSGKTKITTVQHYLTPYSVSKQTRPKTKWKANLEKRKIYLDNMSPDCNMSEKTSWCR